MAPSIDEFFGRAMQSFRTGNLGDAEQSFKDVLRQDPRHLAALNLLGIVLTHVRKYEEAEPHFKTALLLNPEFGCHPLQLRHRPEGAEQAEGSAGTF